MDALILLAVLVGLSAFVAAPLYTATRPARLDERTELEARRDATTTALQELELDRTTGLVSEEEYVRQRDILEGEAAHVRQKLQSGD